MTETHVISALVKRRSELTGEIDYTHERLRKLAADLEALDATILQFDADYRVEQIRPKGFRPPNDWANRGEMSTVILTILRQAAEPLTTRDIALELMTTKAMDIADERMVRKMTKRTGVALRHQRENGVVESKKGPGVFMLWKIEKQL